MPPGAHGSRGTCLPCVESCEARRAATIGSHRSSMALSGANSSGCVERLDHRVGKNASQRANESGFRRRDEMYLSQNHISRRTVLRGVGATIALPLLEA